MPNKPKWANVLEWILFPTHKALYEAGKSAIDRITDWSKPKPLKSEAQWQSLYEQMQQVLQGQMPAYYDTLAKNVQSAMQSQANTLLSKAMANLSVAGLQNSGISNAVVRDINAMISRDLGQYLGGIQQQIFNQALGMLPSTIQGGFQSEAFNRQLQAENIRALINAIAMILSGGMQALSSGSSNMIGALATAGAGA